MDEVSIHELARRFNFLEMPIGVYAVAPDGRFLECNLPVRRLLGLPLTGPISASIADFYTDPHQRGDLLQKALEAEERGSFLEKEIISFHVDSHEIFVEDYCKPLRDPSTREILGYVGCLVDVTAEQHKVDELTFDIGRVLHANTSTLLMAQQTLDGVAEALSRRTVKEVVTTPLEELDEQLTKQADQLANAVERLLQTVEPARRLQALPQMKWDELTNMIAPLRQVRDNVPVLEMRPPPLRTAAHRVSRTCQEMAVGILPRELIREAQRASEQLENTACLIDVLITRTAIIQMDSTLRSLRDFITSEVRTEEQKQRLSVKQLTEQAISHMAEFARSSRVDIVWRDRDSDAQIEGSERDLVRALSNLLHNAIKYTWRRDRTKSPWVTVRTYVRDGMVCIEFENWGVPITQEEIDDGLIYRLGYRGKLSKDRGRLGTGIGLTDAKRTALAYHGDLFVTSRPAGPGPHHPENPEYYNQPFITTVTLCLPE
jgi:signal transduction histidine kinase